MNRNSELATPAIARLRHGGQGTRNSRVVEVVRALLGFSRVGIATFAVAQAGLGAVLALRGLPSLKVTFFGTLAVLSASYAFTATNDALDVEIDRKRFKSLRDFKGFDVGSLFIRHPLAQGIINLKIALSWILSLMAISLLFTYLLKPWLILVFLTMAALVSLYSFLNTISCWKILIIATFVALGAVVGWLAVAEPSPLLFIFGLWIFFWEVGGRNIPNDFADLQEDRKLGLKTVPTVFGVKAAAYTAFVFLVLTFLIGVVLAIMAKLGLVFLFLSLIGGVGLLIRPGLKLVKNPKPQISLTLFNLATLYPPFILLSLLISFYL